MGNDDGSRQFANECLGAAVYASLAALTIVFFIFAARNPAADLTLIGLLMDLFGFSVLATDVLAALRNEREAYEWMHNQKRSAVARRYTVVAPQNWIEKHHAHQQETDQKAICDRRILQWRRMRVNLAIGAVLAGFLFQIADQASVREILFEAVGTPKPR